MGSERSTMTHREEEGSGEHDGRGHYGPWVWSAYRAYNELLREKLKKRFDAREGPWLDRVADVLVEIVDARWEGGRKKEKELEQLFAKLEGLLEE
jgi:hypothetical protein